MTGLIVLLLILRALALFIAIIASISTLQGIHNGGLSTIALLSNEKYLELLMPTAVSWTVFWLLGQEQLYTLLLTMFS